MFINLNQRIECSKCGSSNYETFRDSTHSGTRCKSCGHENKKLHEHLMGDLAHGGSWTSSQRVEKF